MRTMRLAVPVALTVRRARTVASALVVASAVVAASALLVASAMTILATPASAQLPQASATALGLGFNTTASSRGFAAVANNPAGLGLSDSPGFSLAVPALAVQAGLGPVTLQDLVDWQGTLVPATVKDEWLARVTESGSQSGAVGAGLTPLAFSLGGLGVQLSSQVGGETALGPDAVQLLLYGNAGRTGEPEDLDLDGSSLDGSLITTLAVAYGFRVSPGLHLGLTGKYTVGTALLLARDAGSALESDPPSIGVRFPALFTNLGDQVPAGVESDPVNNGSGVGLDIGAIWSGPALTVGATIQNLFNTFSWNVESLSYIPGEALFQQGNLASDFEERAATDAPQTVLDAVEELKPKPVFAVGVELEPSPILRLTGDIRKRVSGGLGVGPAFHIGTGAELRAVPFLPLRAHFAVVSGGVQVGGGAGLVLGPMNLNGAIALRTGDFGSATLGMVTLSFGGS